MLSEANIFSVSREILEMYVDGQSDSWLSSAILTPLQSSTVLVWAFVQDLPALNPTLQGPLLLSLLEAGSRLRAPGAVDF